MKSRRFIRMASAWGILTSAFYLIIAFVSIISGRRLTHANLMLYGVLMLFPYSVALAYVASVARKHFLYLLLTGIGTLLLIPLPLITILGYNEEHALLVLIVAGVLGAASTSMTIGGRKGSVRLSLTLVTSSFASMAIASAAIISVGALGLVDLGLSLVLAFPVPLIYAVTVHSLPSTFDDHPNYTLSYPLPWLSLFASLLVVLKHNTMANYIIIFTLILYIYSARLYKWRKYSERLNRLPEGPARKGMKYFLWGHISVIFAIIVIIAYLLDWPVKCTPICHLHMLTLGFVSLHVWIHGPMMLPVILSLRHRRRFTPLPYILLLTAMIVFPISMEAALALYLASLLATIYIAL